MASLLIAAALLGQPTEAELTDYTLLSYRDVANDKPTLTEPRVRRKIINEKDFQYV